MQWMLLSKNVCRPAVLQPYTSRKYNRNTIVNILIFKCFSQRFYIVDSASWYDYMDEICILVRIYSSDFMQSFLLYLVLPMTQMNRKTQGKIRCNNKIQNVTTIAFLWTDTYIRLTNLNA